jgi:hypothetical protein
MTTARAVAFIAAAMVAVPAFVAAQNAPEGQASPSAYRPGLGDLMTATVQPRHIKLAYAGREKNWTYAAYELHELEEAFDRLSIQWPEWQRLRIVELVESIIRQPLFDLDQAIKQKNDAKFATAYGQLTDGCNACHEAAGRPFVAIQEPKEAMYPDQDFRPKP